MVYTKHDPTIWNANSFLNLEVVSWYVLATLGKTEVHYNFIETKPLDHWPFQK